MNSKTNKKTTSKGGNNGFKGFFNPIINAEIKTAVNRLDLGPDSTTERVFEIVQMGFKFSLVSDEACTHFTFSLYDRRPNSNSNGYVLSIKHSDLSKGIALLYVLVREIYQDKGWKEYIDGVNDIDW